MWQVYLSLDAKVKLHKTENKNEQTKQKQKKEQAKHLKIKWKSGGHTWPDEQVQPFTHIFSQFNVDLIPILS